MRKCNFGHLKKLCDVHKVGSSSFKMHDQKRVFDELNLKEGDSVLDLGCGPGDYAIESAKRVGDVGKVFALEKQQELIDYLNERTKDSGIKNIRAITYDITDPLPLEDNSIDVCIIVTVLHIPNISKKREELFAEITRVLKPKGKLVTIDVKKEDMSFGPPIHLRVSPEDIEKLADRQGFEKIKYTDLGYCYMIQFTAKK